MDSEKDMTERQVLPEMANSERSTVKSNAIDVSEDKWNQTETEYPRNTHIHSLFERQVEEQPSDIAIVHGSRQITYRELNDRANQLAAYLREKGVKPNDLVGICLDRGIAIVVAMLAILKAGATYVPLAPEYPARRRLRMMEDSGMELLLTESALVGQLVSEQCPSLCLDTDAKQFEKHDTDNVDLKLQDSGDQCAYVMYTSGSTGRPKGAIISHRSVVRLVLNTDYVSIRRNDRMAQASNASFDAATFEVWGALLNGACLITIDRQTALSPRRFGNALVEDKITTLFITTALFNQMAREAEGCFKGVRDLLFGGEQCDPDSIRRVLNTGPPERLLHVYGPTENTTFTTWHEVKEVPQIATSVPIGKPIANSTVYVLNEQFHPCKPGEPGELLIGGDGLAKGYLNNRTLTDESFIEHPFQKGERLYRSGDRVRRLEDGSIDFLGRLDRQVKLRGYRIELGEIESVLLAMPEVREAKVMLREDNPGEKSIAAYVVTTGNNHTSVARFRDGLAKDLPDYMIPSTFTVLDEFPLNPNGKVDLKALPKPTLHRAQLKEDYIEPASSTERFFARRWSEYLHADTVGATDNFLELGGHSLIALRLIGAIREEFAVELMISDIFGNPTVRELSAFIEQQPSSGSATTKEVIPIVNRSGPLPVSPVQEHLLLESLRYADQPVYNEVLTIHLGGSIDPEFLGKALNTLLNRHEIFRTSYDWESGDLHQIVHERIEVKLPIKDFRKLEASERSDRAERFANEWSKQLFDLRQAPQIRAFLGILSDDDYRIYILSHHLAVDAHTSFDLVSDELQTIYLAYLKGQEPDLPKITVEYGDYASWKQTQLKGDKAAKNLSYWTEKLSNFHSTELPTDKPRPKNLRKVGARKNFQIPSELSVAIKDLAKEFRTTPFVVLLAAFKVLIYRQTNEKDLVLGSVAGGRDHPDTQTIAGCFINYLILRSQLEPENSFSRAVETVKETTLDAIAHQDVSLTELNEALQLKRDASRGPFYQIMFLMEPPVQRATDAWSANQLEFHAGGSKLDLTFELDELEDHFFGRVEFNTELFLPETIDRLIEQFQFLLSEIVQNPTHSLNELSLISEQEETRVLKEFNNTAHPVDTSLRLHDGLARFAKDTPDKTAVVYENDRLTYRELNTRAENLAFHLQELGVQSEQVVAVIARRSLELPTALFGVLKSGAAYLPIDPDQPEARVRYLLENSGAKVALLDSSVELPTEFDGCSYAISELADKEKAGEVRDDVLPENLAYVIYTSGSTGHPKGSMIEHKSIMNRMLWMVEKYNFTDSDVQIQKTPITFDVSLHELFTWSMVGAKLILPPKDTERDPALLIDMIRKHGITFIHFVPSMLDSFLSYLSAFDEDESLKSLRMVYCSGEALPPPTATQFKKQLGDPLGIELHNLYGPTEAAVEVSSYDCKQLRSKTVMPIGKPIWNTQLYVLDKRMRPVPIGIVGELYIGGIQVSRGYLNNPELTEQAFVPDPFSETQDAKLYKTGDTARLLPNGDIEYLGRNDHQIKIRGVRVEPGEIEEALRSFEDISASVVVAKKQENGHVLLIAYYTRVSQEEDSDFNGRLLKFLKSKLPSQLVPSHLVSMESFPLNQSGKLDRKALPEPNIESTEETLEIEDTFQDPIEGVLASIWCQLLNLQKLERQTGFFELGGHSLSAVKLLAKIRSSLGITISLPEFLDASTFEGLLEKVKSGNLKTTASTLKPRDKYSPAPVSSGQKQLWFLHQIDDSGIGYNICSALKYTGDLDVHLLEKSILSTVHRHEALRTIFLNQAGEPVQQIREIDDPELNFVEQIDHSQLDFEPHAREFVKSEWNRTFDLEKGPLFFARIVRYSNNEYLLTLCMHHIVADEISEGILFDTISGFYAESQVFKGLPKLQIADYATWERNEAGPEYSEESLDWWKSLLENAPSVLELPTDFKRPSKLNFVGDRVSGSLSLETSRLFKELVQQSDATGFMGLQVAWAVFLGRLCATQDVVIGAPVSLRNLHGLENTVGYLLNSLPFRVSFSNEDSFNNLVTAARNQTLDTYRNADFPFERDCSAFQYQTFQLHFTHFPGYAGYERSSIQRTSPR